MGLSHLQQSNTGALLPRKSRRLRGYRTYVDTAGLIHIVPREQHSFRFPLIPFAVVVSLGFVFKALAMVNVGVTDYSAKVQAMQSGSVLEQMGALVLAQDPATMWLYQALQSVL